MQVKCDCKDWQKSMPDIVAQSVYCSNRPAAPMYQGSIFRFCPWCGKILRDINDEGA